MQLIFLFHCNHLQWFRAPGVNGWISSLNPAAFWTLPGSKIKCSSKNTKPTDHPNKMEKTTKQEKNEERKWNRILVTNVGTSSSLDPSKTCSPPFKQLQVGISCQAHQMHLSMHLMFLCTCQWQLFGGTSKSCFVRDLGRFPLGREFLTQQEPNFSQQQKKTTNGSLTSEQNTPWSCKFKFKKQISKKHTKQKKWYLMANINHSKNCTKSSCNQEPIWISARCTP